MKSHPIPDEIQNQVENSFWIGKQCFKNIRDGFNYVEEIVVFHYYWYKILLMILRIINSLGRMDTSFFSHLYDEYNASVL